MDKSDALIKTANLRKLPLHTFTEEMMTGRYVQYPDVETILRTIKKVDYYEELELDSISYLDKSAAKGILLP
jgi:hypothetical protein